MQYTTLLPKLVCDNIEKACRNFIWGDESTSRKMHLIDWDFVCSPKIKGGLGLRKMHDVNKAFMLRASRRFYDKKTSPLVICHKK